MIPTWPLFDDAEIEAVAAAVRTGKWWRGAYELPEGSRTEETSHAARFERLIADMHHARHGLVVNSGSMALDIAVRAAGLGPGDEVITTPYSYAATATCILQSGATPVFADINLDSWNLDVRSARAACTPRTRALIVVHFGGRPADMDSLLTLARERDLLIIEDAAHAFGASLNHQSVGTLGHLGCFSFQASKNISTGEGGAIVTNDDALAARCRSLHTAGRDPAGDWYAHDLLGWNARMTEFQAAIGLAQLRRFPAHAEQRERNARHLLATFAGVQGVIPQSEGAEITSHGRHLLCFRYDPDSWGGISHKRMFITLRTAGLPVLGGYGWPLYRNQVFTDPPAFAAQTLTVRHSPAEWAELCPNAETLCRTGFWIHHSVLLAAEEEIAELGHLLHRAHARFGARSRSNL
jgi:dTDP-4-amino-4,6-dideoxygalactose transaminase